jgi:hypothetical protein
VLLAAFVAVERRSKAPLVPFETFRLRTVLGANVAMFAAGMGWFPLIPADGSFVANLLGPSLLVGLGLPASFIALTVSSVEGVAEHQYGLASGLINTTRQIGGALGLAILAAVANGRTGDLLQRGSEPAGALTAGFRMAPLVGAGFVVVAIALAALITPRNTRNPAIGDRLHGVTTTRRASVA